MSLNELESFRKEATVARFSALSVVEDESPELVDRQRCVWRCAYRILSQCIVPCWYQHTDTIRIMVQNPVFWLLERTRCYSVRLLLCWLINCPPEGGGGGGGGGRVGAHILRRIQTTFSELYSNSSLLLDDLEPCLPH